MGRFRRDDGNTKPDDVLYCENIARGYKNNNCDFEDYSFNLTVILVGGSEEHWIACFETMPAGLARPYLDWLRANVESCDFEPHPDGFLIGGDSEEYIEARKKELRPKYVALVALAKQKLV